MATVGRSGPRGYVPPPPGVPEVAAGGSPLAVGREPAVAVPPPGAYGRHVLVVVDDDELAGRVRELVGVAGARASLTPPGTVPRGDAWARAGLVVVDARAGERLAASDDLPAGGAALVLVAGESDPGAHATAAALAAARLVALPSGAAWLVTALADACEPSAPRAVVIGVSGCAPASGVVDSGLVTAALARLVGRAAGGRSGGCLVLDADPGSPGADLRLAAEEVPGPRWPDLADARGRLPVGFLARHLPHVEGVHLLSADRSGRPWPGEQACETVLASAWRGFDVVLADLGTASGGPADAVLARAAHVVLVVPAGIPGLAAARRRLDALTRRPAPPAVHALAVGAPGWSLDAARRVLDSGVPPPASWTPLRVGSGERSAALRAVPPPLRARRAGLARSCREVLAEVSRDHRSVGQLLSPPGPPR